MEILAQLGGLTGLGAFLWMILRFMDGMPRKVLQWAIVIALIIASGISLAIYLAWAVNFIKGL